MTKKYPGMLLREKIIIDGSAFAYGISSAFDALVARKAGHKTMYVGGYAASGLRGLPDMGIMTATEMLQHIQYICEAVPDGIFIVDIDDGYGGVHNARRIVRDLLTKSSIAAFHIEDQKNPKRCGHIAGKEIVSEEEFLAKLQAVIEVRREFEASCLIIARTDAFSASGGKKNAEIGGDIDEAIKRGLAYSKAGADLVWCEFPTPDRKSAKEFAGGMKNCMPIFGLAFNVSPSFSWHKHKDPVSAQELRDMGYKLLFSTYPSLTASANAVYETAKSFLGDPVEALKCLQQKVDGTLAESVKKIVGVDRYQEIEMRYDLKAKERIESTDGFKKI